MPRALSSVSPKEPSQRAPSQRSATRRSPDSDSDEEFTFDGENVTASRSAEYHVSKQLQAVVVKGAMPTDFTKGDEATQGQPHGAGGRGAERTHIKVTPYIPQANPRRIRERSLTVLEQVRREVELRTGQLPRLVYDEDTGLMLPREHVVEYSSPAAQPAAAESRIHYQRSVDALRELREERMMRHFESM
jgi:hypothetical protein